MGSYAVFGRVLDVINGSDIENGVIVVKDKNIVYAGEEKGIQLPEETQEIRIKEATILPGFIDCHAHFIGESKEKVPPISTPKEHLLINAVYDIGVLLDSGFTAARDMSSFGIHLKQGIERGCIRGPRIVPGGQVLSITSGHGDMDTNYPLDYVQKDNVMTYLVDGVEGCLKGVRKQFREGAQFIKICATGGVSSQVDGLDDVQFSDEELKVMVEEAKRHGTYVTAHCTGLAGAKQALKAGIKCVEHGITLDEECIDIMVKNDVSLVTTVSVSQSVTTFPGIPEFMRIKAKNCWELNKKSIALAHKAGINIGLGTDYTNTPNTPFEHIGREFKAITDCGFTNMEAIQTGTINAAKILRMEEKIGSLNEGKLADIVVIKGNPLEDIDLLTDSVNVKMVMKDGKIEKMI